MESSKERVIKYTNKGNHENSFQSTALLAVALQDHWMRNLTLQDHQVRSHKLPPLQSRLQTKKPVARAVVDTGRTRIAVRKMKKPTEEQEYVLDAKPPPLSLAQKLGLVDAPVSALSEGEWADAKARSNARQDSVFPCVICKEDFGTQQQVLLSCTHVFHRACLAAFEKFSGKKCCPMCRKEQYQTRVIHEGARHHRHACAIKIQAAWRGYVVRCMYKKLRETVPPKDPKLRKKFYQDKLASITDRMVRSLDCDINSFLQELDRSLEKSRDIFKHFDNFIKPLTEEEWQAVQLKAIERAEEECPICLTQLEESGMTFTKPQTCCDSDVTRPLKPNSRSKRMERKHKTISLNVKSNSKLAQDESSVIAKKTQQRARVLLSCSHVFHNTCLEALEEFAVGERRHVCPVCRNHYQKKVVPAVGP